MHQYSALCQSVQTDPELGNREKFIDQLHQFYGPVVQISPKQVSVNSHAGFHEIFAMSRRLDRPPLLIMHNYGSENLFSTVNGELHRQRRQPLRTMYAARSIESSGVQCVFKSALEDLAWYIDAEVAHNRPIDIYLLFQYLGCDIMGSLVYGPKHSLRLLRHEVNRQVFEKDLVWIDKRFFCLATLIIFLFPRNYFLATVQEYPILICNRSVKLPPENWFDAEIL